MHIARLDAASTVRPVSLLPLLERAVRRTRVGGCSSAQVSGGNDNELMHPRLPQSQLRRRIRWAPATLSIIVLAACTPATVPPARPLISDVGKAPTAQASSANHSASATATETETEAIRQARFERWLDEFRTRARAAGITEATLRSAFAEVRLLPRVIELDRSQPEFNRTVWDYLDRAVSPQRIANGRDKLQQLRPQAEAAAARFGVPAPVLVAVWGLESNFGSDTGDIPVVDALATLAFDGRREAWARDELIKALKILQTGDIDIAHMTGSWAGAMGQTQFIPSVFLAHAVDADGDGRRDIWGSMPDVLHSTANFFAHAGWRANEPWGLEVSCHPDSTLSWRMTNCEDPACSGPNVACNRRTDRPCRTSRKHRCCCRPGHADPPSWSGPTSARSCATTTPSGGNRIFPAN